MSKKHFPRITKTDWERRQKQAGARYELAVALAEIEKKHDLSLLETIGVLQSLMQNCVSGALEWELEQREKETGEWGEDEAERVSG